MSIFDQILNLKALQQVITEKPQLLIGSPMCKAFSILQASLRRGWDQSSMLQC